MAVGIVFEVDRFVNPQSRNTGYKRIVEEANVIILLLQGQLILTITCYYNITGILFCKIEYGIHVMTSWHNIAGKFHYLNRKDNYKISCKWKLFYVFGFISQFGACCYYFYMIYIISYAIVYFFGFYIVFF